MNFHCRITFYSKNSNIAHITTDSNFMVIRVLKSPKLAEMLLLSSALLIHKITFTWEMYTLLVLGEC